MKHMRTVLVPSQTREEVEYVSCDICGGTCGETDSGYGVNEVEIRSKQGTAYPEGGDIKHTYFEICNRCFDEKLVPALHALGAEPHEEDESY